MTENIILEKQVIEKAKIVSCKIEDATLRKRTFVLNIAANIVAEYLNKSNIRTDIKFSLYRVPSFAQNLELADIYVEGKRLDVRVTIDGEIFGVPKVHEKYEVAPCAYLVLKLDKNLQNAELLGFSATKDLPEVKSETEYYEYGTSILQPISELTEFLSTIELKQKIYSASEHEKIKELSLAFLDNEISESEKVYFIKHVLSCPICREVFCDTNDFDTVVKDVKNYPELLNDNTLSILSGNKQEIDAAIIANMAVVANEFDKPQDEVSVDFLENTQENSQEETEEEQKDEIEEIVEETLDVMDEFPIENQTPVAPVEIFDEISLDSEDSIEFVTEDNEIVETKNETQELTFEETDDEKLEVANFNEEEIATLEEELVVEDILEEAELPIQSEVVEEMLIEEEIEQLETADEPMILPMGVPVDHLTEETLEFTEEKSFIQEETEQIIEEPVEDLLFAEENSEIENTEISTEDPLLETEETLEFTEEESFIQEETEQIIEEPVEDLLFAEENSEIENTEISTEDSLLETEETLEFTEEDSFIQEETENFDSTEVETLETAEFVEEIQEETLEMETIQETIQNSDLLLSEENEELLEINEEESHENILTEDIVTTEEPVLLEHDEDQLSLLDNHEEFELLEEIHEEPASVKTVEPEVERKSYDFSLETDEKPEEPIQAEIEENSTETTAEETFQKEVQEPTVQIYPSSSQEPVELVYDDEEDDEEDENTSAQTELTIEENTDEEESQKFDEENVKETSPDEPAANETDSDIQQLLDDDLLALLADDNTETTPQTHVVEEEVVSNIQNEEAPKEEPIENLFENESQTTNEERSFELPEEPISAKTVSATKRFLVLLALLLLVAGGSFGTWFMNNAKNQAENYGDGLNMDAESYNIQETAQNNSNTPAISQDINKSMTNSFSDKPAAITITKLSWRINEKLAADTSVNEYLQTAGKNIQMNLQNDLANAGDVNFNNLVKVAFEISQENELKGIQVLESSGSDQIDDIVVRGIKNTLKYVSVPKVKDFDSDYFLTLIINF